MIYDSVLIGKNIRLSYKLTAKEIYVSPDGEVTIITSQYGPNVPMPQLTVEYLESICSRMYYGGYNHKNAIADIMLLNSVLRRRQYDDFYAALQDNLEENKMTIIASPLF